MDFLNYLISEDLNCEVSNIMNGKFLKIKMSKTYLQLVQSQAKTLTIHLVFWLIDVSRKIHPDSSWCSIFRKIEQCSVQFFKKLTIGRALIKVCVCVYGGVGGWGRNVFSQSGWYVYSIPQSIRKFFQHTLRKIL